MSQKGYATSYSDDSGTEQLIWMGSYGFGPARAFDGDLLVGELAEAEARAGELREELARRQLRCLLGGSSEK